MGRKNAHLIAAAMIGLVGSYAAGSDMAATNSPGPSDWPHWAGPNGDCTSSEKGLLKTWPKGGPPVLWRIPVGIGSNHPSVAGNDLCFAQLDEDASHETVRCVDADTGKDKWSHTYEVPPVWHVGWGELGVRATPTITDKYVYEAGTFGNGFCFERATGKIVWQHDFRKESPYLDGSLRTTATWSGKALTGRSFPSTIDSWCSIGRAETRPFPPGTRPPCPARCRSSPTCPYRRSTVEVRGSCPPGMRGPGLIFGGGLPITFHEEDCVVIHGNRQWKILRQADGKQVWNWECRGPNEAPAWASGGLRPVGGKLYMDNLDGWQTGIVDCDFSQADPRPKVLWSGNPVHEAITPPVIVNGRLYGLWTDERPEAWEISGKPEKANFSFRCTDLTSGKLQWLQPGFHMGLSMMLPTDISTSSYQTVTLVEATAGGYVERGRIEKVHKLKNWALAAIGACWTGTCR